MENDALYQNLDYQTVEALQMRNPNQYPEDREFITGAMRQHRIFRLITDASCRRLLLARLLQIDYEIPSIHTFLEDTKWLEPCSNIVRKHLFPKAKGSSYSFLYRNFDFSKGIKFQNRSLEWETLRADRKASFTIAYRQIFMYAWRYFPELSDMLPRTAPKRLQGEEIQTPKPKRNSYNYVLGAGLQHFAHELGFKTETVCGDPEINMILQFLEGLRPRNMYRIDSMQLTSLAREIQDRVRNCYQDTVGDLPDNMIEIPMQFRCGRPLNPSFQMSKSSFFYKNVYGAHSVPQNPCFMNNANIFKLFFGKASEVPNEHESLMETESDRSANSSSNSNNHEVDNEVTMGSTEQESMPTQESSSTMEINNHTSQRLTESDLQPIPAPSSNPESSNRTDPERLGQEPQRAQELSNTGQPTPKRAIPRPKTKRLSPVFQTDLQSVRPIIVDHHLELIKIDEIEQWTKNWLKENRDTEYIFYVTDGGNNTGFTERCIAVQAMKTHARAVMHIFTKSEPYHSLDHEPVDGEVCSCVRAKRARAS